MVYLLTRISTCYCIDDTHSHIAAYNDLDKLCQYLSRVISTDKTNIDIESIVDSMFDGNPIVVKTPTVKFQITKIEVVT